MTMMMMGDNDLCFYNNNNNDKDDAKIRENTNLHFQYLKYTTVKDQPQPDLRQKCLCQSG